MRQLRSFIAILITLALVLTFSGFTNVLATVREPRPAYVLKSHSQQLLGIKPASLVREETDYIAAIHYPVTGNIDVDGRITAYIATCLEQLSVTAANGSNNITPKWGLTLYSDYEVFAYSPEVVSFKFESSIYGGGIAPKREITTLTFNLRTGSELTQGDLFSPGFEKVLSSYVGNLTRAVSFSQFVFTETHLLLYEKLDAGDWHRVEVSLLDLLGVVNFRILNGVNPQSLTPSSKAPKIALTFDDGPHALHTTHILNELKKRNAVATFFVLGSLVEDNARLMRRMAREGHEIGNHSWDHPNLSLLSPAAIVDQLGRSNAAIQRVTGQTPAVMRPPFGFSSQAVKSASDMPIIRWSVDPKDWEHHDVDTIVEHIVGKAKNGDIILLHDIYGTTADAVGPILDALHSKGFEFVTVSELLSLSDYPPIALAGRVFNKR